jgi:5-methyltetrahydropteroyltriglutamate--homocysteine methyltransferase
MDFPLTTTIGSYPIFPKHEDVEYYEMMKSRGLEDVLDPHVWSTEAAVKEFVSSGIEVVSTGQTRGDLYSIFLNPRFVKGIAWNGSEAYVKGRIERLGSSRKDDVRVAREILPKQFQIKEPITDAYTLAKFLKNRSSVYPDLKNLAVDINRKIVIPEIEELQKEKLVSYIQLDSPRIAAESIPEDYYTELYEEVMSVAKVPVVLHACGDTARALSILSKTRVHALLLDFYHFPKLIDEVSRRNLDQALGVGALDAQSPRVETVAEVSRLLKRAVSRLGQRLEFVHPHCGQRSLDRSVAFEKNCVLTMARDDVFFGEAEEASGRRSEQSRVESGYFLVQSNGESGEIVATYYDMKHRAVRRYRSRRAEDVLLAFSEESNKLGMDSVQLAKLAMELGRAETRMRLKRSGDEASAL